MNTTILFNFFINDWIVWIAHFYCDDMQLSIFFSNAEADNFFIMI